MRRQSILQTVRGSKARVATFVFLGLTTISGCSCEPPTPNVHVSPGTTVEVGQTVTFDSNSQPGDPPDHINSDETVSWDLDGNGTFELEGQRVVQRKFDVPGTYKVTFDAAGLFAENLFDGELYVHGYSTQTITVIAPPGPGGNQVPTAAFGFSPDPAITEYAGTYDASASTDPDGQIVKYEWQWGDGTADTTTTTASVKHAFGFPGSYTVHLTVTDDRGGTGVTDRTVQVQDGPPPGKVIAQEAAGVSAAGAGSPFTIGLQHATITPGTTTASGAKLVTAGIRAHGRLHFTRVPRLLGRHQSPRWAGSIALVQRGSGTVAKLSGQGYILLVLSRKNSVCLAGTASGTLLGRGFQGKLAVAGGTGSGARLRGAGTFSPAVHVTTKPELRGRLKLRQAHRKRGLPKACRALGRVLGL